MLTPITAHKRLLATLTLAVVSIAAMTVQSGHSSATTLAYGKWTGYAMNKIVGANSIEIFQGYAANHVSSLCPGDPAASWPYGTTITNRGTDYVPTKGQYGDTTNRTFFYLEDGGDPGCTQGNYWVDAYFGRYEPKGPRYYFCDGDGQSYYGYPDNCLDAGRWGTYYLWYNSSY